jgi:hypothetical protein
MKGGSAEDEVFWTRLSYEKALKSDARNSNHLSRPSVRFNEKLNLGPSKLDNRA